MNTPEDEYNNLGIKKNLPMDLNPVSEKIIYNSAKRPTQGGSLLPGQTIADLTFVSGYSQRRIRITMNPVDNPVQNAGSIAIIDENGNFIAVLGFSSGSFGTPVLLIAPPKDQIGIQVIGADDTTADLVDLQLPDPSDAEAIRITQNGAGDGILINIGPAGTGRGIVINLDNNSPGIIVTQSGIGNAVAGQSTGGKGGDFTSVGNFAIGLQDFDPAGGIFQRIIELNGSALFGPVVVLSDGTDPNGVLTAPVGSLCILASPTGDLAKNVDGADTWVNL